MKLKNNRSGFTLLEIIIVIIIVGVLASLALPRFFNTIEFSRSTEALNVIGGLKRAADRCALANEAVGGAPNWGTCLTWAELATEDPGNVPGAAFTYGGGVGATFGAPGANDWQVVAANKTTPANTITFTYNISSGAITRVGVGPYAGLK